MRILYINKTKAIIIGIIFLGIIFVVAVAGMMKKTSVPKAQEGIINLSSWELKDNHVIRLNGEWEFYWNALFTHSDFEEEGVKDKSIVAVPKVWNQYKVEGKSLPGFGYATYRLRVKAGSELPDLSIGMHTVSTNYKLFVNDKLLASNGELGISPETSKPEYYPLVVTFTPPEGEFDIIIQVSNFTYARGGLWYEIVMGEPKHIEALNTRIAFKDAFLLGGLFMMVLYYASIFIMHRYDKSNLYFIIINILLMLRTSQYGSIFLSSAFPSLSFEIVIFITYATLIWLPVVLHMMIEYLFIRKKWGKLSKLLAGYASSATLLILSKPISIYTSYIYVIEGIGIIIFSYALILAIKAHLKEKKGALVVLIGGFMMLLAGIHDVLYQNNSIYHPYGEMSSMAMFIFMFLLSFLLAKRSSDVYYETQKLSLMLGESLEKEQALTEKLYTMDRIKDEFLANTSHELRTPLNGIINITQSVIKGVAGELNAKQNENLQVVVESAKGLYNLINDILDVSAIKNNELKLYPKPISIRVLTESILVVMENLKGKKEIIFKNSIPNRLPAVMCDEERLRQIFYNLIGNALKFTEKGTIEVEAKQSGDFVIVSVSDTGPGISNDKLCDVFNSFERLDTSIDKNYEGTGLGLFITKRLIELHGGEIWIRSEIGKGSSFSFNVPVTQEKAQNSLEVNKEILEIVDIKLKDLNERVEADCYTILAVDDDRTNLKALTNHLRFEGYTIKCVENGYEALDLLESGVKFDLVILDVMMPGISGYKALEKIRSQYLPAELPVLLLTARNSIEDITIGFNKGANDYLTKPFEAEELIVRVRNLVQFKQAIDNLVKVELAFLQAQIKPHFIFNALSVISSLSTREPSKAKELILDLSDYLRGSFDIESHNSLTTLQKELELVRAYLSIEQARFKERLNVIFDIACDRECTIPILSVQPLVENAVRHGIMPRSEGGEVRVSVIEEGKSIRISVSDNGMGIDEEKIQKFLAGDEMKKGSVGLKNINKRLITLYGKGLVVTNELQRGTRVEFVIPLSFEGSKEHGKKVN